MEENQIEANVYYERFNHNDKILIAGKTLEDLAESYEKLKFNNKERVNAGWSYDYWQVRKWSAYC